MSVLTLPLPLASSSEKPKGYYMAKTYLAFALDMKSSNKLRDGVEWKLSKRISLVKLSKVAADIPTR